MQEYSVRVSFLELYNEELFDLLSTGEDSSKIRIFEDSARKVESSPGIFTCTDTHAHINYHVMCSICFE